MLNNTQYWKVYFTTDKCNEFSLTMHFRCTWYSKVYGFDSLRVTHNLLRFERATATFSLWGHLFQVKVRTQNYPEILCSYFFLKFVLGHADDQGHHICFALDKLSLYYGSISREKGKEHRLIQLIVISINSSQMLARQLTQNALLMFLIRIHDWELLDDELHERNLISVVDILLCNAYA